MRDLSAVRQGWAEIEQAEACLSYRGSARDSFCQWLQLQRVFEPQLRETAELFATERRSALGELQSRLCRLAAWQETHGESGSVHSEAPAAPAGS